MEMPRGEMEMVDAGGAFDSVAAHAWEDVADEGGDSWDGWQIDEVAVTTNDAPRSKPSISVAAASIKTAAALERESGPGKSKPEDVPRVSPDVFRQGMTVTHPEYGPGKIIALSGSDKNRRATIQFATVGQKKIILAHSQVRPAQ
jgi:hypothetical protein